MKLREWSLRRWLLVGAAIVLLPLIGARLHLKWRVHRAVAELREAGQPTRYNDLYRLQGVVPDAPNMVAGLTNAVIGLRDLSQLSEAERDQLPLIGQARIPPAGSPWPAEMQTATRDYLDAKAPRFAEIQAALQVSNAWWWASYDPEKWNVNMLGDVKAVASHFSLQAAYLAQSGQTDAALEPTQRILGIGEKMYRDPLLITHLVRNAIQAIGIQRLEFVLSSGEPSETGLVHVRDALHRQMGQESLADVYQGELVFFLEPAFYRSQRMWFGEAATLGVIPPPGTLQDFKQRCLELLYRMSGLADRDILFFIEANRNIATLAGTLTGQVQLANTWTNLPPSAQRRKLHYWSEQYLNTADLSFLKRRLDTQRLLHAADAALAVALYRLQHDGKLPASLDELVPEFLEAVPVEPQSGKPFELIVTPDGYGIGRGTPVFSVKLNGARQQPRPFKTVTTEALTSPRPRSASLPVE